MSQPKLTMVDFLAAVVKHGSSAREALIAQGHHPKVIWRKAEKAADKNYTEYGVVADRPWLTPTGEAFLAAAVGTNVGTQGSSTTETTGP